MRTPPVGRTVPALMIIALFAAACGDDGPTEPSVGQVEVTVGAAQIAVGQTTQATATVRDGDGNVLSGRPVTWSSSPAGLVTVDADGVVTAVATGMATITAESGGRTGSAQVEVLPASAVQISSISPAVLRAGEAATIEGEGFSSNPSSNTVTIGGERVNVTAATETSLQIAIPSDICLPSGSPAVQVRVGNQPSGAPTHAFENTSAPLALEVGRLHLISDAGALCVRLGATTANETYLIGVQSVSPSAARIDDVRIAAATGAATLAQADNATGRQERFTPPPHVPEEPLSPRGRRWALHREAEVALRQQESELLPLLLAESRFRRSAGHVAAAQSLPAGIKAGDTVTVRVPTLGNICNDYTEIRTVVRTLGERGIWLDDVANPPNGLTQTDFDMLSDVFDNRIWTTNVAWFGEPSDLDSNGRVAIVTTKEVNKAENTLGFVVSSDLLERTTCASSNIGEFYYARAADPTGQHGGEYTVEDAREDAVQLIGHEFTHIIQFSRRIFNPSATAFQTAWELEGQAVFAEEVNGHAATGRSSHQNYGFDVAFTGASDNAIPSEIAWYVAGFTDLALYYGFNVDGSGNRFRTQGAPEQCSWLARSGTTGGSVGPCVRGREVYGTPWSFFRWMTDHIGATYPGGPQAMHRDFIGDDVSGFATIEKVTGEPIRLLLAQWAATLYLDDRMGGLEERLTLPSWDLVDIFEEHLVEEARLLPRVRSFAGIDDVVRVRGGSTAYFRVSATGRPETHIRVRRQDGARLTDTPLQVWVVRMN